MGHNRMVEISDGLLEINKALEEIAQYKVDFFELSKSGIKHIKHQDIFLVFILLVTTYYAMCYIIITQSELWTNGNFTETERNGKLY